MALARYPRFIRVFVTFGLPVGLLCMGGCMAACSSVSIDYDAASTGPQRHFGVPFECLRIRRLSRKHKFEVNVAALVTDSALWTLGFTMAYHVVAEIRVANRRNTRERSGHCPICGYDLTGATSDTCTECGTDLTEYDENAD